ncbi:hypothetical protein AB1Y20_010930 [Prymnesium parvum]|uniref:Secreted protein n=1 Tax=Prymnesium parvum TaxID=97485 RepID=A0AB34ISR7_PRYPA
MVCFCTSKLLLAVCICACKLLLTVCFRASKLLLTVRLSAHELLVAVCVRTNCKSKPLFAVCNCIRQMPLRLACSSNQLIPLHKQLLSFCLSFGQELLRIRKCCAPSSSLTFYTFEDRTQSVQLARRISHTMRLRCVEEFSV